ncbi:MAG TPA: hypothetical protein PKC43_01270 [Phycisphaerales bacterium]|nr:hypothetical protein [Phycisphaerales bacterium]HMP36055.1 hypothetical protein [Phycisphaerales bacterium]
MSDLTGPPHESAKFERPDQGGATFDDERSIALLRVAARGRPLESIAVRLAAPDAGAWIVAQVDRAALTVGGSAAALLEGAMALDALRAIRSSASRRAQESLNERDRLAALIVYTVATAAAMVHHRVLPSRAPREEWDERLVALSAVAPPPWGALFRNAADTETDSDGTATAG